RPQAARFSSFANIDMPEATSFGAARTSHRTTRVLGPYKLRRSHDLPASAISVFNCDPSSKVAPPPEAFDLIEPRFPKQMLVLSGCDRHEDALERKAFALDLFGRVPV